MIADAERYRRYDLEHRERVIASTELEYYCSDVKRLVEKINHPVKKRLVEKCEQTITWMAVGPLGSVKEMTVKKEEIECLWKAISID